MLDYVYTHPHPHIYIQPFYVQHFNFGKKNVVLQLMCNIFIVDHVNIQTHHSNGLEFVGI